MPLLDKLRAGINDTGIVQKEDGRIILPAPYSEDIQAEYISPQLHLPVAKALFEHFGTEAEYFGDTLHGDTAERISQCSFEQFQEWCRDPAENNPFRLILEAMMDPQTQDFTPKPNPLFNASRHNPSRYAVRSALSTMRNCYVEFNGELKVSHLYSVDIPDDVAILYKGDVPAVKNLLETMRVTKDQTPDPGANVEKIYYHTLNSKLASGWGSLSEFEDDVFGPVEVNGVMKHVSRVVAIMPNFIAHGGAPGDVATTIVNGKTYDDVVPDIEAFKKMIARRYHCFIKKYNSGGNGSSSSCWYMEIRPLILQRPETTIVDALEEPYGPLEIPSSVFPHFWNHPRPATSAVLHGTPISGLVAAPKLDGQHCKFVATQKGFFVSERGIVHQLSDHSFSYFTGQCEKMTIDGKVRYVITDYFREGYITETLYSRFIANPPPELPEGVFLQKFSHLGDPETVTCLKFEHSDGLVIHNALDSFGHQATCIKYELDFTVQIQEEEGEYKVVSKDIPGIIGNVVNRVVHFEDQNGHADVCYKKGSLTFVRWRPDKTKNSQPIELASYALHRHFSMKSIRNIRCADSTIKQAHDLPTLLAVVARAEHPILPLKTKLKAKDVENLLMRTSISGTNCPSATLKTVARHFGVHTEVIVALANASAGRLHVLPSKFGVLYVRVPRN